MPVHQMTTYKLINKTVYFVVTLDLVQQNIVVVRQLLNDLG